MLHHTELRNDDYKPEKDIDGKYKCNLCDVSIATKQNMIYHRAFNHQTTTPHFYSATTIDRQCPVSGLTLNKITTTELQKHVNLCKKDFIKKENRIQIEMLTTRESKFKFMFAPSQNNAGNMINFLKYTLSELKIQPYNSIMFDLALYHALMTLLCLREGIDYANGHGFWSIKFDNIIINENTLFLEFMCKTSEPISKNLRIEPELANKISLKLKSKRSDEYFFCSGMNSKERTQAPGNYCKQFHIHLIPSMCRNFRASLEFDNTCRFLVEKSKLSQTNRQTIVECLNSSITKSGQRLTAAKNMESNILRFIFANTRKLLGHKSKKYIDNEISHANTDLHYIDDRLVYTFLREFLEEEPAKYLFFKLYNSCLYKSKESYQSWSGKHNWAFDPIQSNISEEMFDELFFENNWIF